MYDIGGKIRKHLAKYIIHKSKHPVERSGYGLDDTGTMFLVPIKTSRLVLGPTNLLFIVNCALLLVSVVIPFKSVTIDSFHFTDHTPP
jgi:hypothetical protein